VLDDIEEKSVFSVRVRRTSSASGHHYAAVWNAEEIPDQMVSNLLDYVFQCVRGSVYRLERRTPVSLYGEYHFDTTQEDDIPF
jgi:hypothetical protein